MHAVPSLTSGFEVLTDPQAVPPHLAGAVVAIGNFDGVHRGHTAVIAAACAAAAGRHRPAMALTFEPHPRSFFRPQTPVQRLTDPDVKLRLLAQSGLAACAVITFDAHLAALTAEDFVKEVLVRRLAVSGVVVGYDFHFGRHRSGTPEILAELAAHHGFTVQRVGPEGDDVPVSSSAIRSLLGAGHVAEANRLIGRRWFVSGTVGHGDKRGRELGFPTANVMLDSEPPLSLGIYAVRARVDGRIHDGVASYGRRPTFDNGVAKLEVYLFDFAGDLYGKRMDVEFVAHLRGEEKFDSIDALVAQMNIDAERARAALREPPDPGAPSALG